MMQSSEMRSSVPREPVNSILYSIKLLPLNTFWLFFCSFETDEEESGGAQERDHQKRQKKWGISNLLTSACPLSKSESSYI